MSSAAASSASSRTPTFTLPDTSPAVRVTHPHSLTQDQILTFPAFKTWLNTLQRSLSTQSSPSHPFHSDPYSLKAIEVQTVDTFSGGRPGFLKLRATVTNDADEHLPGSVFMRGGSVAMLIILKPRDEHSSSSSSSANAASSSNSAHIPSGSSPADEEEYAVLTIQPRIPAGSLSFVELPAGMLDDAGSFDGAAAKEIQEETGLEISTDEMLDMTQLALESRSDDHQRNDKGTTSITTPSTSNETDEVNDEPHLQQAIYPSPGGSDEFIPVFLVRKSLPRQEIQNLKGRLTGLRDHGEKITLKIVPLRNVWKVAARDGKTLAALTLYHGLKSEGRL